MVILREQVRTLTQVRGGRTPFTEETWAGKIRAGLELELNQTLLFFILLFTEEVTPFAFARTPLESGEEASLIDMTTGLAMPYTILAGYNLVIINDWHSFNQPSYGKVFLDGFHFASAMAEGRGVYYEQNIIGFESRFIDPTYALPHTWEIKCMNLDLEPLSGQVMESCILSREGSVPWSKTKIVRCKYCGHKEEVNRKTTKYICPVCGEETWYLFQPIKGVDY